MVYSEVPNFSEPNPEYSAQQAPNKTVSPRAMMWGRAGQAKKHGRKKGLSLICTFRCRTTAALQLPSLPLEPLLFLQVNLFPFPNLSSLYSPLHPVLLPVLLHIPVVKRSGRGPVSVTGRALGTLLPPPLQGKHENSLPTKIALLHSSLFFSAPCLAEPALCSCSF